jgi:ribonuclease P protein component
MLPKTNRLNLKTSFRWVASGKTYSSPFFKLFYRTGENNEPLVGVSIVTASFKQATLRNKAKRLMFELAREYLALLPNNINLVIMPKPEIFKTEDEALRKEFRNALSVL